MAPGQFHCFLTISCKQYGMTERFHAEFRHPAHVRLVINDKYGAILWHERESFGCWQ